MSQRNYHKLIKRDKNKSDKKFKMKKAVRYVWA